MYVCLLKWGCFPLCQEKYLIIYIKLYYIDSKRGFAITVSLSSPCKMAFCTMVRVHYYTVDRYGRMVLSTDSWLVNSLITLERDYKG